jgi:cell division protein FtsB
VGWIACCLLVVLLLPIGAMLYLDILQAKKEVSEQVKKVETLRRQVEQKQRENEK